MSEKKDKKRKQAAEEVCACVCVRGGKLRVRERDAFCAAFLHRERRAHTAAAQAAEELTFDIAAAFSVLLRCHERNR